ncbi:acyl-CoA dehydratase activase-related protein [Candidatus Formimonas warabiya]|uniref:DUF2229 domain-containing protein n=1 Tax=Formimonas warabiya TaxID=1761012 RepID=A0A3G1KV11_FORW1|nr:acyl-CoA dehydratase activase-related protein [Candidatus Formimonas warabiya]ATW26281.1 hypothetical protein DCMF_17300 [Candidatus Formimonas warabiya]
MKIGIPRALLFYYYFPLWKTLFEELGHEVIISDVTKKKIVDAGVKVSVPEICVPIKIFNGHILNLIEKKVDYFFIPRMISVERGLTFCPKFLGLPDMARYTFPALEGKIITPKISAKNETISDLDCYREVQKLFNIEEREMKRALRKAKKHWMAFRKISKKGYLIHEAMNLVEKPQEVKPKVHKGDVTIGLIGYVYDVYDEFVSMNIASKLEDMGANVLTFEMLEEKIIAREIKPMNKALFWTFSNKILGAGINFYKDPRIDGIVHVTAFGCGPDSLLGKLLELDSGEFNKPFMTVRVDEHTGESHLQTRIEAFVDMLRKKKKKRVVQ